MVTRPRLRSFFTGLGLYALAAALIGYFGLNAYTGDHGLRAREQMDKQIATLTSELAEATAERDTWQRRITLLTTNYLDTTLPTAMPASRRTQLPSGQAVSATREDSLTDRLGMRIRSRLYEMCRTIELFAPDYRREVRQAGRMRS